MLFLWYGGRSCTLDILTGSKCASTYIYIQVKPIEIIYILEIFAVKHFFYKRLKEEWNEVAISELKDISKVYISYLLNCVKELS